MLKDQTSVRGGIEDFLCPFKDMYITQGSNSNYSHKGIMANDVRGKVIGMKEPYYAPCTCKCLKVYPVTGQVMWQSINKVRFANGRIDYATFMTAHDNTVDAKVGQIVSQGKQLGNMGNKGFSDLTGVHCHIEVSQSSDTSWYKNKYGNYQFNHEYDLDDCYFVDNTNILNGMGGSWKKTTDVLVNENNLYITLYNMKVRDGAGTNFSVKKVKELSLDGQKHATSNNADDDAIYKKDTIFTAKEIISHSDGSIWAKSPSGYICIRDNQLEYCRKL